MKFPRHEEYKGFFKKYSQHRKQQIYPELLFDDAYTLGHFEGFERYVLTNQLRVLVEMNDERLYFKIKEIKDKLGIQ